MGNSDLMYCLCVLDFVFGKFILYNFVVRLMIVFGGVGYWISCDNIFVNVMSVLEKCFIFFSK